MSNPANVVAIELFPDEAELNVLATNMTEKDMKALIIQMYRMQKKIYAFTSELENMLGQAQNNPMLAAMMPRMGGK